MRMIPELKQTPEPDEKFIVRNNDTGEVYDIRELEHNPVDKYSFFPENFQAEVAPVVSDGWLFHIERRSLSF